MRFLVLPTLALAALSAPAQEPVVRDAEVFRSGIELTSIAATVRDADGRLVTGLPRDAFEVYEDGERQSVTQFTSDRVPLSLGVLLDVSDSMFGRRLDDARAAVYRFLFDLLDPGDEFFVLAFNHQPRVLTPWTHSANVVQTALDGVQAWGGTSAYDAVLEALPLVARRHRERAALVLISDGADTASNSSVRDVVSALHRSDTFLYAIAIDPPERQAINTRVNPTTLRELTNQSGGRTEVVQTTADLNDASARIAEELNHQYVFGYTSTRAADGRFHSIRVRIAGANHKVSTRSGYVADRRYRRE